MARSKLKLALKAEKGQLDPKALRQMKEKKKHKAHLKEKKRRGSNAAAETDEEDEREEEEHEESDDEEEDDERSGNELLDLSAEEGESDEEEGIPDLNDSDTSESEVEFEEKIVRPPKKTKSDKKAAESKKAPAKAAADKEDAEAEEEGSDDEESLALSDLEDLPESDREDIIPHQKLRINNTSALKEALARIALPTDSSAPFAAHQSLLSKTPTADAIPDVHDDLQRELQFYAQSLDAAKRARALLRSEGVPFTRPADYFAEMVKADDHMEKVKAKLVEEATAKKAAAEARKLRDLRKFGKQVQVAKLQERAKAKKDTLEKIKELKRKRSESGGELGTNEADDLFDVAVEKELKGSSAGGKRGRDGSGGVPNPKRQKKNEKYGFGGKKRHAKSGDAASSGDMTGFSVKKMKGRVGSRGPGGGSGRPSKAPRPGKSRRKAAEGRR